jgi:hypothetical protein
MSSTYMLWSRVVLGHSCKDYILLANMKFSMLMQWKPVLDNTFPHLNIHNYNRRVTNETNVALTKLWHQAVDTRQFFLQRKSNGADFKPVLLLKLKVVVTYINDTFSYVCFI